MSAETAPLRDRLAASILELRRAWRESGQAVRWSIFSARFLAPAVGAGPPAGYARLAEIVGEANPELVCGLVRDVHSEFLRAVAGPEAPAEAVPERIQSLAASLPPGAEAAPSSGGALSEDASDDAVRKALDRPGALAPLLTSKPLDWNDDDLAVMWRHQLQLPLLGQIDLSEDLMQQTISPLGGGDPSEWSLGELLFHGCPPVAWLEGVEISAKRMTREGILPRPIASMLYLAAVASALAKRDKRTTRSSDEVLRLGFSASLSVAWIDEPTRALLQSATAKLRAPQEDASFE
jgi:hypothetical protein